MFPQSAPFCSFLSFFFFFLVSSQFVPQTPLRSFRREYFFPNFAFLLVVRDFFINYHSWSPLSLSLISPFSLGASCIRGNVFLFSVVFSSMSGAGPHKGKQLYSGLVLPGLGISQSNSVFVYFLCFLCVLYLETQLPLSKSHIPYQ